MTNKILSRRGSTMVEIIVALALVSIVSIMIVSFTAMTSTFAGDEQSKHDFVDSCAAIRRDINDFLLTCDIQEWDEAHAQYVPDKVFVSKYQLTTGTKTLGWSDTAYTLIVNGSVKRSLKGVKSISFEKVTDRLVKCTVSCDDGTESTQIFVFALRCATFVDGGAS